MLTHLGTGRRRCCASAPATTCSCGPRPLRLRPHGAARALHRPHRRHADRARRQRVSLGASARSSTTSRPAVSGVHPDPPAPTRACRQEPPLPIVVELGQGAPPIAAWPSASARRLRDELWLSPTEIELVPSGSLPRSEYKSKLVAQKPRGGAAMRKLQTPGRASHHAGRRRPPDLDRLLGRRARHAVHLRAAQSRQRAAESHLYFDPGDGRLITVFTDESRKPDPSAHRDRHRLRPPHRLLRSRASTFLQAVEPA